jgi:hypothetical protein
VCLQGEVSESINQTTLLLHFMRYSSLHVTVQNVYCGVQGRALLVINKSLPPVKSFQRVLVCRLHTDLGLSC